MNNRWLAALALLLVGILSALLIFSGDEALELGLDGPLETRVEVESGHELELPSLSSDAEPTDRSEVATRSVPSADEIQFVLAESGEPALGVIVEYRIVDRKWMNQILGELTNRTLWHTWNKLDGFEGLLVSSRATVVKPALPTGNMVGMIVAKYGVAGPKQQAGFGFLGEFDAGTVQPPSEIRLALPTSQKVRVVNAYGEPMVGLRPVYRGGFDFVKINTSTPLTSSAGIVSILNLNLLDALPGSGRIRLEAKDWKDVKVGVTFGTSSPTEEPLLLQMDGGCSATVRVVDEAGQAILGQKITVLFLEGLHGQHGSRILKIGPSGTAKVSGIPPGVHVAALHGGAYSGESRVELERRTARGETELGREVSLDVLVQLQRTARITGRVLDGSGSLLADTKVVLLAKWSNRKVPFHIGFVTTNADGRFAFEMNDPRTWPENFQDSTVQFYVAQQEEVGSEWVGVGPVLPGDLQQRVDLGDLQLAPPEALAAGKVVDQNGLPIVGAQVTCAAWPYGENPLDEGGGAWFLTPLRGVAVATTDSEGNFQSFGSSYGQRFLVRASAEGYVRVDDAECRPGDTNVRLAMQQAGRLGGFVKLGKSSAAAWLIGIQPMDESARAGFRSKPLSKGFHSNGVWSDSAPFPKSGLFAWLEVPPGRYNVRVIESLTRKQFLLVEDIVVEAGKDSRDPRLQGVDLSGQLKTLTVRIVDENGRRMRSASVGLFKSWEDSVDFIQARRGELELQLSGFPVELFVCADGYRLTQKSAAAGVLEVKLERGYTVKFQLPQELVFPEGAEVTFSVSTRNQEALRLGVGNFALGLSVFDEAGKAKRILPVAGEHTVRLRVSTPGTKNTWTKTQEFTIPEGGFLSGQETVELTLTQADIDGEL